MNYGLCCQSPLGKCGCQGHLRCDRIISTHRSPPETRPQACAWPRWSACRCTRASTLAQADGPEAVPHAPRVHTPAVRVCRGGPCIRTHCSEVRDREVRLGEEPEPCRHPSHPPGHTQDWVLDSALRGWLVLGKCHSALQILCLSSAPLRTVTQAQQSVLPGLGGRPCSEPLHTARTRAHRTARLGLRSKDTGAVLPVGMCAAATAPARRLPRKRRHHSRQDGVTGLTRFQGQKGSSTHTRNRRLTVEGKPPRPLHRRLRREEPAAELVPDRPLHTTRGAGSGLCGRLSPCWRVKMAPRPAAGQV